jgi:hypothetical protein
VSEALAKLIAPASDCLVCHGHTALEEQFLDVAQAQLKAEMPAHSATDDLGWETVTVIERFRFLHHAILRDRLSNLTTPAVEQKRLASTTCNRPHHARGRVLSRPNRPYFQQGQY